MLNIPMTKIVVWDTTGRLNNNLEMLRSEKCVVVGMMEGSTEESVGDIPVLRAEELIETKAYWDLLVVFDHYCQDQIEKILKLLKLEESDYLFAYDVLDLMKKQDVARMILQENSYCLRRMDLLRQRNMEEIVSCTVDGINYVGRSSDNTILPNMILNRVNWAKEDMHLFFELAKEYYGYEDEDGIFLDIGGNIGTTSIYVKKRMNSKLKVIAFEPVDNNYKMFKANMFLNDLDESDIIVENIGLSNEITNKKVVLNEKNPGASNLVDEVESSEEWEEVVCTTLDIYIEEHNICPEEIKYIWMDVEGYEGFVFDGADKTLGQNTIPMFMEYVPEYLERASCKELLHEKLEMMYSKYICIEDYKKGIREPKSIKELALGTGYRQCDLFLIK